jgi:hypothetical protein
MGTGRETLALAHFRPQKSGVFERERERVSGGSALGRAVRRHRPRQPRHDGARELLVASYVMLQHRLSGGPSSTGATRPDRARRWPDPVRGNFNPAAIFIPVAACSSASTTVTSWWRSPDPLGGGPDPVGAWRASASRRHGSIITSR